MFIVTNEYRSAYYSIETEAQRNELISRGFIDITEEKKTVNKKTSPAKKGLENRIRDKCQAFVFSGA